MYDENSDCHRIKLILSLYINNNYKINATVYLKKEELHVYNMYECTNKIVVITTTLITTPPF